MSIETNVIDAPTTEDTDILAKDVVELNLSSRGRRCMRQLGISTLGELVQRSPKDLLVCKNFGVVSLAEVKHGLALFGLRLAGDHQDG